MTTVLSEISQWASGLPFWEQAALEKIVTGVDLSDADYDELLQYLFEDTGLAKNTRPRLALTFPQMAASASPTKGKPLRLLRMSNLCNVNALVPDQELTFGEELTVIFGANASGKSGYARVIGSAAFTRGDKKVLMNVTRPADSSNTMSAEFQLTDGEKTYDIAYEVGKSCPELGTFYVFDSTSVRAHLTRSNPMSFSPSGLAYLTRLSEATDKVRGRLQTEIDKRTRANPFAAHFVGDTEVSRLATSLSAVTDVETLRRAGTFSTQDEEKTTELDRQIAKLKSDDIPGQITTLEQVIRDLMGLVVRLEIIGQALSDERLSEIATEIAEWKTRSALAQSLSAGQFQTDFFSQIGTELWQGFVEAAHALAHAESTPDRPYPQPESRCLLCHQSLSEEARGRLERIWAFLKSNAQTRLQETEGMLDDHYKALAELDLRFFDDQAVTYRHLQAQDAEAFAKARAYLDACLLRRDATMEATQNRVQPTVAASPANPMEGIQQVIATLRAGMTELREQDPAAKIEELEKQKLELEHRRELARLLPEVEQYVADCQWISVASDAKTRRSTAHITKKHNDLFSKLVTEQYLRLFEDTLRKLKCPLNVKVRTKGQKGETVKQIALETDASALTDPVPPDKVLSEGEQRAVALADFLTEVALDDKSTGVVLDDPVTSLDFEWKDTVASHLAAEAKRRQVIVFTHDLHFLYCMKEQAEKVDVTVDAHWIERRDDKPGWVFLDNSPLAEKDYKTATKARKAYDQAKPPSVPPEERQKLLQQGFAALRTCYEAFVVFDLFGGVVMRFSERIGIDQMRKVAIDLSIRDEVINKVGLLSRYIEGHLHSDQYVAQKPTPEMLLKEIEEFEAIKKRHKDYKKSQGIEN